MVTEKRENYCETLSRMIRKETVSRYEETDHSKFEEFRDMLEELFPKLFEVCEKHRFQNGIALLWKGDDPGREPVLFMNHHDVVEATGEWKYAPFSGICAEGKLWGRGTLDDKGGLWAMLQAGEELAEEGFSPSGDIWFISTSTEETTGEGAAEIAEWFREKGIHFKMSFDEGGMILDDPISGVKGTFAMIGVGEKGSSDLKFIARSNGGHASTPEKNTPLVRLGKFMAAVDRGTLFQVQLSPTIAEMFRRVAPYMGKLGLILGKPEKSAALIKQIVPRLSGTAAALFRTTIAFTMAQGSEGLNVIPQEAWVTGNVRYSHHQGQEGSLDALRKLAKKFDIEMEIISPGMTSRLSDYKGDAFRLAEDAVREAFPNVEPVPYIMTGASDSRFFDSVSEQCIRFVPFWINDQQLGSVHGINENVNIDTLEPAVCYYRYLITEVQR